MIRRIPLLLPLVCVSLFHPGCVEPQKKEVALTRESSPSWIKQGSRMMVATDSKYASQVGLDVLKAGGNAIDAACAVSFALSVTRPESTGIGGGGFLIARFADGKTIALDYRECAPAASYREMYADRIKEYPVGAPPSQFGYLAPGTPGLVAGHVSLIERYGTMPLGQLLAPAVRLASDGYKADEHYVNACRHINKYYEKYPELKESCGYVYRTHLRDGQLPKIGDKVVQPELGRLIEQIAWNGKDGFYRGPFAESLATTMRKYKGVLNRSDLAAYQPRFRQPVGTEYRGYIVASMPPPSSGGICLIEVLNILEQFDLPGIAQGNAPQAMHLIAEAMKHAFADRARWLGDADYVDVPVDTLISPSYGTALAKRIELDATSRPDAYGITQLPDDAGTSHYCIVDAEGNCVVATETINTYFGSLAAIDEWGLILNNEMDDFTAVPGQANAFGLTQSELNTVQPFKRPLSSMTPTIVFKDEQPVLLLGASGGPRIISSVLNVLLYVLDFGYSLEQAMGSVRVHHQWMPDEIMFDQEPDETLKNELTKRGHTLSKSRRSGIVQVIQITPDGMIGASDPRKGGKPAGE